MNKILRKFFNVTVLYSDNKNSYWAGGMGSGNEISLDINKAKQYFFLVPFLPIIRWYINFVYEDFNFRIRKIWMPTIKIDGSVKTYVLKGMKSDD
jgi:hypothetical protein